MSIAVKYARAGCTRKDPDMSRTASDVVICTVQLDNAISPAGNKDGPFFRTTKPEQSDIFLSGADNFTAALFTKIEKILLVRISEGCTLTVISQALTE